MVRHRRRVQRTEGAARRWQVREGDVEHDAVAIRHRHGLDGALDVAAIGKCRLVEGSLGQCRHVLGATRVIGDGGGISQLLQSRISN